MVKQEIIRLFSILFSLTNTSRLGIIDVQKGGHHELYQYLRCDRPQHDRAVQFPYSRCRGHRPDGPKAVYPARYTREIQRSRRI